MRNFQEMIATLTAYWAKQGCAVHQGYDLEVGAGTFNPATFLRCLGPEPYSAVYVEPSRRPQDGRYGENPNRVQFYHQMQVILKPSPPNMQDLYLQSLESIGLHLPDHDIRFVHDDWENPTIGAWGLGWEVWIDGMEMTQYTYFQAVGGMPLSPISGELTYGLERLAMYLQDVESIFDLQWNETLTYGDIYKRNEYEWSHYNFHEANVQMWQRHFEDFEKEALKLVRRGFPIPAYDFVMKASHAFNILDARGSFSVTERARYIARIRMLAKDVAECYLKSREAEAFPLLKQKKTSPQVELPLQEKISCPSPEDFLLEIGSEELPASFIPLGMKSLEHALSDALSSFPYEKIEIYGTPRRLAARVFGLHKESRPIFKEKKGPALHLAFTPEGKPTRVGEGFFQSLGLPPEMPQKGIEVQEGYLYAKIQLPQKELFSHLKEVLPKLITGLDFPRKMRWGELLIEYARPLRWILALYGKEIVPFALGDLFSGRKTWGHRFLSKGELSLSHPSHYLALLREHKVIADVQERRELILEQLPVEAALREKVLPQVLHLVEYPFVMKAPFSPLFLKAPQEVLISEMVEHQKYFPLLKEGKLLPSFAVVTNVPPSELIQKGNTRALSPRLADGMFLFEEDLKLPLEHFNEQLKKITYQSGLGSLSAKEGRLVKNVELLHHYLPLAPLELATRAASLCKADLASALVREFPELQGVIGKIYALHHGEKEEVANAIAEHWMPLGENAPLPQGKVAILLSLADKIDHLLSLFILGEKPSSSSDPFGLRRSALGIIKILLHNKLHLPLKELFSLAFDLFLLSPEIDLKMQPTKEEVLAEISSFFMGRLRMHFQELGFEKDEIEAVLVFELQSIYDLSLRLEALHDFRKKKEFKDLIEVQVRTKKILLSQNKNLLPRWRLVHRALDGERFPEVDEKFLQAKSERELFSSVRELKEQIHTRLIDRRDFHQRNYPKAFLALTKLQKPTQALFEEVKVIADDPHLRVNRLALLQEVYDLCEELADFSKLSL